jgi:hypothetical protein
VYLNGLHLFRTIDYNEVPGGLDFIEAPLFGDQIVVLFINS